jgi:hypothetical protein
MPSRVPVGKVREVRFDEIDEEEKRPPEIAFLGEPLPDAPSDVVILGRRALSRPIGGKLSHVRRIDSLVQILKMLEPAIEAGELAHPHVAAEARGLKSGFPKLFGQQRHRTRDPPRILGRLMNGGGQTGKEGAVGRKRPARGGVCAIEAGATPGKGFEKR